MEFSSLDADQIALFGGGIVDISVAEKLVLGIAPSDSHELVINRATYVTQAKGGNGVARQTSEFILKSSSLALREIYSGDGRWYCIVNN